MTADAPYAALLIELRHIEGEAEVEVVIRDQGSNPFTREAAIRVLSTILDALQAGEGTFFRQGHRIDLEPATTAETFRAACTCGFRTRPLTRTEALASRRQHAEDMDQDSLAKNQSASLPADVNRSHS